MSTRSRRGTVILTALAMSIVIVATAWAAVSAQVSLGAEAAVRARDQAAQSLAESGLELALARLDADPRWTGVRGHAFWEGTIDVEAAPIEGAPGRWRIRSVGRHTGEQPMVAACCIALVERRPGEGWGRLCWRWDPDVR